MTLYCIYSLYVSRNDNALMFFLLLLRGKKHRVQLQRTDAPLLMVIVCKSTFLSYAPRAPVRIQATWNDILLYHEIFPVTNAPFVMARVTKGDKEHPQRLNAIRRCIKHFTLIIQDTESNMIFLKPNKNPKQR